MDYHFAYLFLDLCLLPVWLLLFIHRKDLRKEMLVLGFLIGIAGIISEYWYLRDYWHPLTVFNMPVNIEDFLFGLFMGGIGCVFYEELFGKKLSSRKTRKHHWALIFIILAGISFLLLNVLFFYFKINSIYCSVIIFMIVAASFLFFRKDLIIDAVISGFLCGIVLLISYLVLLNFYPELFSRMWYLSNLSGIFIGKIPIEEIMWAFGWGMIAGPMYEFYAGLKFRKSRRY